MEYKFIVYTSLKDCFNRFKYVETNPSEKVCCPNRRKHINIGYFENERFNKGEYICISYKIRLIQSHKEIVLVILLLGF
jgi:hypothetical protein